MIQIRETRMGELVGWALENDSAALFFPRDFGPRVLSLSLQGGQNLLAVLPETKLEVAGEADYYLRGGHRLWAAPERPHSTYVADDLPPQFIQTDQGLELHQAVDRTGIQKTWQVSLHPERAEVTLNHQLSNQGKAPVELAPWAVTMLRPGGVGLLPLQGEPGDQTGLRPNRQLVVWPYTDLTTPYLEITNQAVQVRASLLAGALKIGAPNPAGWLAYRIKGTLFIKRAIYQPGENYPDRGASHQIYCNPETIELETLGPLTRLEPGEVASHQEIWELYPEGSYPEEFTEFGNFYQA